MTARNYSRESVNRAFELHHSRGLILSWRTDDTRRYHVTLTSGEDLTLRTLREAKVFVSALASAAEAYGRVPAR